MSHASTCRSIDAEGLSDFLARRPAHATNGQLVASLRRDLQHYEERYGNPSHHLQEAVRSGELAEDLDVCDWSILYGLLLRAEAR
jgi:hypothetical protein